jgi:hypothetical protein
LRYFTLSSSPGAALFSPPQKRYDSQTWWYMPIIPAFRRLREEDCKFKASLDYIGRHGSKTKAKIKNKQQKAKGESRIWESLLTLSVFHHL